MKNINITVENKRATVVGSPVIICGNSDYTVTFAFDSDWNVTGVRTARFVYVKDGKVQHEDVVFSGNTVAVPILSGIDSVKIGVFAGELRTTTPAVVRCGASILCGSGEVHEPTPDVYDQIMALFNDLAERGGFGATEAQAQQIAQNQADIAALVSGTKKAGKAASADQATNANTLGGKESSYYAPLTELRGAEISTSILEKAVELKTGFYFFKDLTGASYTGNDLPHATYTYGSAIIAKRSSTVIAVILLGIAAVEAKNLVINRYNGTTWSGWEKLSTAADLANYLPLTGGTINGDIKQRIDTEAFMQHQLKNAKRNVYFQIAPDGGFYLYDETNNKYIFLASLGGGYTWYGTATGNVPLSGGTVDGNLAVNGTLAANGTLIANDVNNAFSYIVFRGKGSNIGYLGINAGGEPAFMDTAYAARTLLHTGNSAKVHIGTSAPSDTSALWIDTSA